MAKPKIRQQIPAATIETLARSVHEQASGHGFTRLDHIRLASALLAADDDEPTAGKTAAGPTESPKGQRAVVRGSCDSLPLETDDLVIEPLEKDAHRAEFRILVGDTAARKRGLGSEAAGAWLAYGLQGLALEKVFVQLLEGDIRSSRLFEKLGFGFEAFLKAEICLDGVRRNLERWALHQEPGAGAVRAA